MKLANLKIRNFRSYKDLDLKFTQPITIFVGPNGIGKTNLIEAIYLLSTTISYRTRTNSNLINWDQQFAKVIAVYNNLQLELRIVNQKIAKEVYLNKAKVNLRELLGKLPVVLFSPETIEIISGSPQDRRRYLNVILAQQNKNYYKNLVILQKIVKQKNSLLYKIYHKKAQVKELDFWNEKLAKVNLEITQKRQGLVDFLNPLIKKFYQQISHSSQDFKIKYQPKVKGEVFLKTIKENTTREIETQSAIFGPHRDEVNYFLDNKSLDGIVSRGELRSAVLALKFAELKYLVNHQQQNPILLLDDIFSELDKDRRSQLNNLISNYQTIITATDLEGISQEIIKKAEIIDLGKTNVAKNR
ncbi:MAG: DNA replication/repair protein RecF [Patescibacteria group bacterium]|nr:DNA replication/repair protein RecF [Patescibacteria group bacterium]